MGDSFVEGLRRSRSLFGAFCNYLMVELSFSTLAL